jgi:hypothetical protein
MHRLLMGSVSLALLLLAGGAPPSAANDGPKARIDPNFAPLPGIAPGAITPFPTPVPNNPAVQRRPVRPQPQVFCDAYGRCWQQVPGYRSGGYFGRRPHGPRGDDRPDRDPYSFDEPHSAVACEAPIADCGRLG